MQCSYQPHLSNPPLIMGFANYLLLLLSTSECLNFKRNRMSKDETIDLSEWVEKYTGDLFSRAYYKVSDTELAKDLVQETFLAATKNLQTFKGNSSPKTWLLSILNNKITDYYRKKVNQTINIDHQLFSNLFDEEGSWKKEKRPQDWHEKETNLLDDTEFQQILEKCLDELPEHWNSAVKLKYLLSKKGEEICQELGISQTNYWQIIHRAKLRLRECLEYNWFKNE